MKAKVTVTWKCLGKKYDLKAGEDVKIDKKHEAHAKASGLFEDRKADKE